jgi:hypothetical protein
MAEYEYRALPIARGSSSGHTREVVGIAGEFGGWELSRHIVYEGGRREVLLRRRSLALVDEAVQHPRAER